MSLKFVINACPFNKILNALSLNSSGATAFPKLYTNSFPFEGDNNSAKWKVIS